jgi:hypothetical protein
MIVVSTDVVAALYVPGEFTQAAEAVLLRDPHWASPMLWRTLLPNHAAALLADGRATPEIVRMMVAEAALLFRSREFPAPLEDNTEIILTSPCSAFMAPFLCLARGLQVPLVTLDAAAIRAFPETALSPIDFAAGRLPSVSGQA